MLVEPLPCTRVDIAYLPQFVFSLKTCMGQHMLASLVLWPCTPLDFSHWQIETLNMYFLTQLISQFTQSRRKIQSSKSIHFLHYFCHNFAFVWMLSHPAGVTRRDVTRVHTQLIAVLSLCLTVAT